MRSEFGGDVNFMDPFKIGRIGRVPPTQVAEAHAAYLTQRAKAGFDGKDKAQRAAMALRMQDYDSGERFSRGSYEAHSPPHITVADNVSRTVLQADTAPGAARKDASIQDLLGELMLAYGITTPSSLPEGNANLHQHREGLWEESRSPSQFSARYTAHSGYPSERVKTDMLCSEYFSSYSGYHSERTTIRTSERSTYDTLDSDVPQRHDGMLDEGGYPAFSHVSSSLPSSFASGRERDQKPQHFAEQRAAQQQIGLHAKNLQRQDLRPERPLGLLHVQSTPSQAPGRSSLQSSGGVVHTSTPQSHGVASAAKYSCGFQGNRTSPQNRQSCQLSLYDVYRSGSSSTAAVSPGPISADCIEEESETEELHPFTAGGTPEVTKGSGFAGYELGADASMWTLMEGRVTTLMVRNIPVKYTQDMLLKEWAPAECCYNFLYLPINIELKRNFGFAFINFVSPSNAMDFYLKWHRKRLSRYNGRKKTLDVTPANIQGRDGNMLQIMRNKNFRIKNAIFKPAIFEGGVRVPIDTFVARLSL